jgi:hypothetical protein
MDLDSFLLSLYVLVDDWWQEHRSPSPPKPGRPALLTDPEVITLAILAQWPRFRSERDFWRFASARLRPYFPKLCAPRASSTAGYEPWSPSCAPCNEPSPGTSPSLRLSTGSWTPPSSRPSSGLFCGQATFGRSASKTEWVYGFKGALVVDPKGVVSAFFLAPASSDERPIGDALVASDRHEAYLADKGFTGIEWERRWLEVYGALVAATPYDDSSRAWSKGDRRWAAGKRQIIEGVICQLKDFFGLERHRAKTLGGLLTRLAAKVAAYTCGQRINDSLGRPLRQLADLLV